MSSPLLLPVKPSEAVALAESLFSLAQKYCAPETLRERLHSTLPALGLSQIRPRAETLAPDPVHSNSWYLIVEASHGEYWLLHLAAASAPESTLFPRPILIARVRPSGEREIIINAIPVPGNVETIVRSLAPHLLARATSLHDIRSVPAASNLAAFFAGFPRRGQMLPGVRASVSTWEPYLPLLLSDWRDGFVFILEGIEDLPSADAMAPFSRFSLVVRNLNAPRHDAARILDLRSRSRRSIDIELDLTETGADAPALLAYLDNLRLLGAGIQGIEAPAAAPAEALSSPHLALTITGEARAHGLSGRVHWKLSSFAE
jgi:hypothetical protein